jgi:hypothetical protein
VSSSCRCLLLRLLVCQSATRPRLSAPEISVLGIWSVGALPSRRCYQISNASWLTLQSSGHSAYPEVITRDSRHRKGGCSSTEHVAIPLLHRHLCSTIERMNVHLAAARNAGALCAGDMPVLPDHGTAHRCWWHCEHNQSSVAVDQVENFIFMPMFLHSAAEARHMLHRGAHPGRCKSVACQCHPRAFSRAYTIPGHSAGRTRCHMRSDSGCRLAFAANCKSPRRIAVTTGSSSLRASSRDGR